MSRPRRFPEMVYLGLVAVLLAGCSGARVQPPPARAYWPTEDWQEVAPEEQGIDAQSLARLPPYIEEELPHVRSVLVVRHGYLVYERYFQGSSRNDVCNVMSVTKSFTSALVGIALKEGYLDSLDQRMVDFFPEHVTPDMDPRVRRITLEHLLTMRSGFGQNIDLETTQFKLQQKLSSEPGEVFAYNSGAVDLLSPILTRATQMSPLEFAEKHLFAPLGISNVSWLEDWVEGTPLASLGLSLTPRDMAKFGYLYLNHGSWDGKEIIPSEFVWESTHKQTKAQVPLVHLPSEMYYGYLWWVWEVEGYDSYFAAGSGGHFICVIPDLDMVIVITSTGTNEPRSINLKIVGEFILPAVAEQG